MPFKKDNNKPIKTNNRFASLASDKDGENGFKKVTGKSGRSRRTGTSEKSRQSKENSKEKKPENSRFKDLETKKNLFSQPQPRENTRWRRDDRDKADEGRKIHRKGHYEERNRRSGFGNRREGGSEQTRKRWNKDRSRYPPKDDVTEYRNKRKTGRVNNFTKRPPAFDVEKENFPSLGGNDNVDKKDDEVSRSTEVKQNNDPEKDTEKGAEKDAEKQEESVKKNLKTDFKAIIKNKKKKFARAPKYSVEPGWVKMRLSKGKIIKMEGPKIQRIQRPRNVKKIHRQIMSEMNERHRFNRDLDGIWMSDILGEDSMLSDDDEMYGYNSGSDNDGVNGAYDDDYY